MSLAEYGYFITNRPTDVAWTAFEYKILNENSGRGTFGKENSQATITYVCDFVYFDQFLDVVMGKTIKSGTDLLRSASSPNFDGANGSLPEQHPYIDNFYAATAEVTPLGAPYNNISNSIPLWPKIMVTVVFRPPAYNVIDDGILDSSHEFNRFTTKTPEGSADFQTSTGFFKFVSDPLPHRQLDITPGQTVAAQRVTYTWQQIPAVNRSDGYPDLGRVPNLSTILARVGTVNSVTFDGYSPGTVLFTTWSAQLVLPQVATRNQYYWNISYVLGIRDYGASTTPVVTGEHIGWNYAFDPPRKLWDLYTTDGTTTGGTMYKYADLVDLFRVGW